MSSKDLSNRKKQPGHDRSFEKSERNALEAAEAVVKKYPALSVTAKGRYKIFPKYTSGCIKPEFTIRNDATGQVMNFEVKKQGAKGNAEERVYKLFSPKFSKAMKKFFNVDYHPWKAIFCEDLATNDRYTGKFDVYLEEDDYFLWGDYNDSSGLKGFIEETIQKHLLSSGAKQ